MRYCTLRGACALCSLFVLGTAPYGPTPQAAALRVVYAAPHANMVIRRVNVAARYATVLIDNAMMEGHPIDSGILVERFSFGWQALETLDAPCRLNSHDLSTVDKRKLMHGMPDLKDEHLCGDAPANDAGAPEQVEAVRQLMDGPLIPTVIVWGNYAIGDWYGAGGGQDLFRLRNHQWTFIEGGGGVLGTEEMVRHGVPRAAWCPLRIHDANCKHT